MVKFESEMENGTRWRRERKETKRDVGGRLESWRKITINGADMGGKGSQEWIKIESDEGRRGD